MSFTKVAPAGIGTEPGNSILIGDSLLHSTGIDIGSNTGIGVTIRKHGDATFTGIITASAFFGDGSGLEGVSSSGIGTPLSDDDTSDLNKVYYVNQELSIGSTVTVNHPSSAVASYTHYQDLVVTDDADFIVSDGDTFIPDVLGIRTSTSTASAATGGRIRAGTITNAGANGAPNFPNGLTGTAGTFTGNLNVAGVLTYEDVTNVDSVGVITARDGLRVTGITTITSGSIQVNAGGNTTQAIFSGNGGSGARGLSIVTESVGAQDEGVILNARASGTTGRIKLQTNSTTALTIDGSGSNGNITANTGNIIIGTAGKGIDYSAQTTSSASGVTVTNEVADHYEEGTWTPVLLHYNSGSFQAPSYSAAGTVAGRYTRMGNIVYITASFLGYNISNATGSSFGQISGLPYPAANVTNMRGVINAGGDAFTTSAVNFATYWNTSTLNSMKYGSNVYDWGILAGGSTKNLTISGFYHID